MNIKKAGSIMYIAQDIFIYVCPTTGVSTVFTCLSPVKDYSQNYYTSLSAKTQLPTPPMLQQKLLKKN
jgi:hypothetical protein